LPQRHYRINVAMGHERGRCFMPFPDRRREPAATRLRFRIERVVAAPTSRAPSAVVGSNLEMTLGF